jgi:hypothetical protein
MTEQEGNFTSCHGLWPNIIHGHTVPQHSENQIYLSWVIILTPF